MKNAKYLQSVAPHLVPREEPAEGYASVVPYELLVRLEKASRQEVSDKLLSEFLETKAIPQARTQAKTPLFKGILYYVQLSFTVRGTKYSVGSADMNTALQYSAKAAQPISKYASQYGQNGIVVSPGPVAFSVNLSGNRFNDQALAGWADQIATQNRLSAGSGIVFLNPQGVVNTDADPGTGVLGYHSLSPSGLPYAFVNVMGQNLSVPDQQDVYALALSHEIAELLVDPKANGSNPEVCDPCTPPEVIILGDNKAIDEYTIGDSVIGASGFQQVSQTFVRPFEGDLVEVKALGMLPVRVTANHPLLVAEGAVKTHTRITYAAPAWKQAAFVVPKRRHKDGDYLVMPQLQGTFEIEEIPLGPYIRRHEKSLTQPKKGVHAETFALNKDTAWLLGIYAAEGWGANRKISFGINEEERALRERLFNVLETVGCHAWIDPASRDNRSIQVNAASVAYSLYFPGVLGRGATQKRVPDFILFHKRNEILQAFLDGYVEGDGARDVTRSGYEVTEFKTVSRTLAQQLQLAYGRLGTFISLRRVNEESDGYVLGRRVHFREKYKGLWCSDSRATRRKRIQTGEMAFYLPVKEVSRMHYSGPVYNLETTDHTYLVSNAIVHNCGPNCPPTLRDYFDNNGVYAGTTDVFPPPLNYEFYINAIVKPNSATQCPAPVSACAYAP
jgi:intein/homing endonuclease